MKRISAVLPVYNEERLLPLVLANIEPHVDEIVIVDGGPEGPSTDKTAEIYKSFGDKLIYRAGTFKASNGSWDMGLHRNTGISNATGDVLLLLSADMLFSNLVALREAILGDTAHKLYFCPTIEFWLDINHIRMYAADADPTTIPSGIMQVAAIDQSLEPYFNDLGGLELSDATPEQRLLVPDCTKLHLGWIRPFEQQVEKHVRNVRQGRWADIGKKLLEDETGRELRAWAIAHVLSYPQIPAVDRAGDLTSCFDGLADMKYNEGYQQVLEDFERQYGISVFKLHRVRSQ
jgi:hypothetical protein